VISFNPCNILLHTIHYYINLYKKYSSITTNMPSIFSKLINDGIIDNNGNIDEDKLSIIIHMDSTHIILNYYRRNFLSIYFLYINISFKV